MTDQPDLRTRIAQAIDRLLDQPNGQAYRGMLPDAVLAVVQPELEALEWLRSERAEFSNELEANRAAVERVRQLHSNEDGICGWCRGPDDPQAVGDCQDWPCATIRALDGPAEETS